MMLLWFLLPFRFVNLAAFCAECCREPKQAAAVAWPDQWAACSNGSLGLTVKVVQRSESFVAFLGCSQVVGIRASRAIGALDFSDKLTALKRLREAEEGLSLNSSPLFLQRWVVRHSPCMLIRTLL